MSDKEFQRKEVTTKETIINATFYNSLGDKIVEIKDLQASACSTDENNVMTIKPFSDYDAEIILDIGRLYNIEISTKEVVTKKWIL